MSTSAKVPNTLSRRLLFLLLEIPRQLGNLHKKYPQPNFAYRHQREASQNYNATARLGEIHAQTLILHGEKDRIASFNLAEEIHMEIKGSKLISFKGGHTFFFWRREQFVNAVEEFLESMPGK